MTPRQTAYLTALADERAVALRGIAEGDYPAHHVAKARYVLNWQSNPTRYPMTTAQASEAISWLLRDVQRTDDLDTTAAPAPDVPQGRYAVVAADGAVKFYKVDRPTEGRWAGYTFVKVQASDEWHPVRQGRNAVLAQIAEQGVETCMRRYGHELGRCGNCGRTLTDETSRAAGIGPDCAQMLGLDRSPYAEAARIERVERLREIVQEPRMTADAVREAEGAVIVAEERAADPMGYAAIREQHPEIFATPAAAMTRQAHRRVAEARLTWRERNAAVAEQQGTIAAPTVYESRLRQAAAAVAGKRAPYTLYVDDDPPQTFADGTAAYLTGMAVWQRDYTRRVTIVDATADTVAEWDL